MEADLNSDNFCRCCLKTNSNLQCMNNVELINMGESVKIIDGLFELLADQVASIFPLESPKICSLCFIHLEISFNFRKKCLESNKMLYEHHQAKQGIALFNIKSELELDVDMDDAELLVKRDSPSQNSDEPNAPDISDDEDNKPLLQLKRRVRSKPKFYERKKKHRCPICGKTVNFQSVLTKHIASHARRKCLKCARTFLRYTQLDKHILEVHGTGDVHKQHECHLCGKKFPFKSVLHRHINHHNKYRCEHCNSGFTRLSNLNEHMENYHPLMLALPIRSLEEVKPEDSFSEYTPNDAEASSTAPSEQESFSGTSLEKSVNYYPSGKHSCHLCDKSFDFRSVLLKHISCHNKHVCSHCNMGFTRSTLLEEHIEEEHQQELQTTTEKKEFRCTICDKVFHFQNVLYKHIASHNQARSVLMKSESPSTDRTTKIKHECTLCGQIFNFQSVLLKHIANHNRYKCKECNEGFSRQQDLDLHMKTSHDIVTDTSLTEEHRCHLCDKVFDFRSILVNHLACHNKHKCNYCQKGFTRSTLLEQHMEDMHDNEISMANLESFAKVKKFKCPMCTKSFHFQNVLIKHIAKHEEASTSREGEEVDLPVVHEPIAANSSGSANECKICGKVFNFPSILLNHIACHEKHKCKQCNKGFTRHSLLTAHMTEQHPIDPITGEPIKTKHCCHKCPKEFDYLSKLQKHLASHEKHKCKLCAAGFTRMSHLNVHINQEHTVDVKTGEQEHKLGEENQLTECDERASNSGNRRMSRRGLATE